MNLTRLCWRQLCTELELWNRRCGFVLRRISPSANTLSFLCLPVIFCMGLNPNPQNSDNTMFSAAMHSFLQWNVEKAGQDQSNGTRFPHHTPATGPPSPYVILPLDTLGPSTAAFSSREPISRPCQTISRPRREARWLPVTVPGESRGLFLAGTVLHRKGVAPAGGVLTCSCRSTLRRVADG